MVPLAHSRPQGERAWSLFQELRSRKLRRTEALKTQGPTSLGWKHREENWTGSWTLVCLKVCKYQILMRLYGLYSYPLQQTRQIAIFTLYNIYIYITLFVVVVVVRYVLDGYVVILVSSDGSQPSINIQEPRGQIMKHHETRLL